MGNPLRRFIRIVRELGDSSSDISIISSLPLSPLFLPPPAGNDDDPPECRLVICRVVGLEFPPVENPCSP